MIKFQSHMHVDRCKWSFYSHSFFTWTQLFAGTGCMFKSHTKVLSTLIYQLFYTKFVKCVLVNVNGTFWSTRFDTALTFISLRLWRLYPSINNRCNKQFVKSPFCNDYRVVFEILMIFSNRSAFPFAVWILWVNSCCLSCMTYWEMPVVNSSTYLAHLTAIMKHEHLKCNLNIVRRIHSSDPANAVYFTRS